MRTYRQSWFFLCWCLFLLSGIIAKSQPSRNTPPNNYTPSSKPLLSVGYKGKEFITNIFPGTTFLTEYAYDKARHSNFDTLNGMGHGSTRLRLKIHAERATRVRLRLGPGHDWKWDTSIVCLPGFTNFVAPRFTAPQCVYYASSSRISVDSSGKSGVWSLDSRMYPAVLISAEDSITIHGMGQGMDLTYRPDVTMVKVYMTNSNGDESIVCPTEHLGREYYVLTGSACAPSDRPAPYKGYDCGAPNGVGFLIMAGEDSTWVEYTPTDTVRPSNGTGKPYRIMLNRGDLYPVYSAQIAWGLSAPFHYKPPSDLSGTHIVATKPIAVYSCAVLGGKMPMKDSAYIRGSNSENTIWEQLPPVSGYGREYALIPPPALTWKLRPFLYRIASAYDSTEVVLNDSLGSTRRIMMMKGQVESSASLYPLYIKASKPIGVMMQNIKSYAQSERKAGDDPVDEFDDGTYCTAVPLEQIRKDYGVDFLHYPFEKCQYQTVGIMILTKSSGLQTAITLDGKRINEQFTPFKPNSEWSYAQIVCDSTTLVHQLRGTTPMWVTRFYAGSDTSKYYLRDGILVTEKPGVPVNQPGFYSNIAGGSGNLLAQITAENGCVGDSIRLTAVIDVMVDTAGAEIVWDFGDGTTVRGRAGVMGRVVHRYTANGIYTVRYKVERGGVSITDGALGKVLIGGVQLSSNPVVVRFDTVRPCQPSGLTTRCQLTNTSYQHGERMEYRWRSTGVVGDGTGVIAGSSITLTSAPLGIESKAQAELVFGIVNSRRSGVYRDTLEVRSYPSCEVLLIPVELVIDNAEVLTATGIDFGVIRDCKLRKATSSFTIENKSPFTAVIDTVIVTGSGREGLTIQLGKGNDLPGNFRYTINAEYGITAQGVYGGEVSIISLVGSCRDTITVPWKIELQASNLAVLAGRDTSVCSGERVTLRAGQVELGSVYRWLDSSGVEIGVGAELALPQSRTENSGSNEKVTPYILRVTNSDGCTGADTMVVTVYPEVRISTQDTSVCSGVVAEVGVVNATVQTSYVWLTEQGVEVGRGARLQLPSTEVENSGSTTILKRYIVRATTLAGCSGEDTSEVRIYPLPQVSVQGDTVCAGSPGQLEVLNPTVGTTYVWTDEQGVEVGSGTSIGVVSAKELSRYKVTATDVNGCSGSGVGVVSQSQPTEITLSVQTIDGSTEHTGSIGDTVECVVVGWSNREVRIEPLRFSALVERSSVYKVEGSGVADGDGWRRTYSEAMTLGTTPQELLRLRGQILLTREGETSIAIEEVATGIAENCGRVKVTGMNLKVNPVCANSLRVIEYKEMLKLSPNPSGGDVHLQSDVGISEVEVLNLIGEKVEVTQEVQSSSHQGVRDIRITIGASGVYVVRALVGSVWHTRQVIIVP